MSFNKVILMGRTGKDPEVKTLKDGKKVATFSLATDNYGKDKDGNPKEPDWHNVTVWDKQAEFVEQYVKKGSSVLVEGRLGYEEYEQTKDGVTTKRNYTRITASSVTFAGSKKDNGGDSEAPAAAAKPAAAKPAAKPAAKAAPAPEAEEPAMADTDNADDLPF